MADLNVFAVDAGGSNSWALTLTGGDGLAMTTANGYTAFTGAETITASVWPGDDLPETFAPTLVWLAAVNATVTLSVSAAQTASVTPGDYYVQLTVSGVKQRIGTLRVGPSPGTGAAAPTICTRADVLNVGGKAVESLIEGSDQGTLGELRGRACRWTWRTLASRARSILESQASRHGAVKEVDPIDPTDGVDAGPNWGPSTIPDTTVRNQIKAIQGYLNDGLLMTDDEVVEANAHWVIHLLYARQIAGRDGDDQYRSLSRYHRSEAIRILAGATLRINTDTSDFNADFSDDFVERVANLEYPPI